MLKQSITYENFDGEEVIGIFYFHYSKAEIMEMELDPVTSMSDKFRKIMNLKDPKLVMNFCKDLILNAYGERTSNGGFVKNQQLRDEFASSEAFSVLLLELVQDAEKLGSFFEGVMPNSMIQAAKKAHIDNKDELIAKFRNADPITQKDLEKSGLNVNN